MKILISGGTGFIGSELVEKLLEKKHQISIITRSKQDTKENYPYPVDILTWEELENSKNEWQGFIHLAGAGIADKRWTEKRKKILYESRITTGMKMVKKALNQNSLPEFFICGSAVGIYGDRGNEEIDEGSTLEDGFIEGLCKDWENISQPLEKKGVRCIKTRTGIVLGTNEGALDQLATLSQMGILSPLGSGKQYMPWIHVKDWVNACIFVIENKEMGGAVNFTGLHPLPHKKFLQTLSHHFQNWLLPRVPSFMVKILFGEMAQILLNSQKVLPKKLENNGFQFEFTNLLFALEDLYPEPEKGFILKKKLILKNKKEEVFPFFSSPDNLEKITPPFLKFKVNKSSDEKVKTDTLIWYRLNLHGIPISWKTRILDHKENSHFIDNQEKGPYKKWHHLHLFEDHVQGTLMTDLVRYKLSFGILGKWIACLYVRKDVNKIFDYRTKVLKEKFS